MDSGGSHKRSTTSDDSVPYKRARFSEPDDDPGNFAEQVDASLEAHPSARKKGRIRNEGYESDSSDDGEGVVPSRRRADAQEEEEEDIFAMADDDANKKSSNMPASQKKESSYLKLGDIEGQEFQEEVEGDDSDEDEPEDEDDVARRKKAGMGYKLSSFNMREEMEEGKFTEDGSYIRSFDPHGIHDRWMEGLAEKDITKARRDHRRREREQQQKILAEEKALEDGGGIAGQEELLLSFLKKGETVLEALQRLGQKMKKRQQSSKRNKADLSETEKKIQEAVDKITHFASNIMSLGNTDIYTKTYEELVRSVRAAGLVDDTWEPPSADLQFEYKWDIADSSGQPGQTFGPYSEDDMQRWYDAVYFGLAGEKVKIRLVGGEWQTWDDVFP